MRTGRMMWNNSFRRFSRFFPALVFPTIVLAQQAAPIASDPFTESKISVSSLIDQDNEYQAVIFVGKDCHLFSDAEVGYWRKVWNFSTEVMLSEHSAEKFIRAKMSPANLDKLEQRYQYYIKTGCGSPELTAKIRDMKKRMRLVGFSLKQLSESNGAAIMDLYKEPK